MQETWIWFLVGQIPWRREWLPTLVFSPGESMDRGAWQATVHGVGVPGSAAPRFLRPAARGRRPEAARRGFGCGGEGSRVLGRGRRGDFRPQWGSRVAAIGGPQEAPPRAGKAWPAPRRRVGLRCCGTLVLGAGLRGLSDHPRIEAAGARESRRGPDSGQGLWPDAVTRPRSPVSAGAGVQGCGSRRFRMNEPGG